MGDSQSVTVEDDGAPARPGGLQDAVRPGLPGQRDRHARFSLAKGDYVIK
jgi:hypothetical protein